MTDIQSYDGPFIVDDVISYFLKDGVWYFRNSYIQLNIACKESPPEYVITEWTDKYGPKRNKPLTRSAKKAMPVKPAPKKPKSSIERDNEILRRKKRLLEQQQFCETSSSMTPNKKPLHMGKLSTSFVTTPKTPNTSDLLSSNMETPPPPTFHSTPKLATTAPLPPPNIDNDMMEEFAEAAPLIMITASEPIVQEAKEKFKQIAMPNFYQQLMDRMEVRKLIMEPNVDEKVVGMERKNDKTKPYRPPTNVRPGEVLDSQREREHEIQSIATHELMTHLLNADKVEAKLKNRNILQKDTFRPVPSRLAGPAGHSSDTLPVECLAPFMEQNDLTILNIDRFITASDHRYPLYNSEGNCVFCTLHRVPNAGSHLTPMDCPYTFCTCVQCFVAEQCPLLRG